MSANRHGSPAGGSGAGLERHRYEPPLTLSPKILNLVAEISSTLGQLTASGGMPLRLRRINQLRTIRGSLAIEGNTLDEATVTAIMQGKRVAGPAREVQEVKAAYRAYALFSKMHPGSQSDLLRVHKTMMEGLVSEAGRFRTGSVGVIQGDQVKHIAPQAARVPELVSQLQDWLVRSDLHPLVTSCVFHYEFEFIHPFADGNGRMGRYWQSLILSKWNEVLGDLPVESLIFERQSEYYQAIAASSAAADSAVFVEFMLECLARALSDTPQVAPQVTPQVTKLLELLGRSPTPLSRVQIQDLLGLKDRKSFQKLYLKPALASGMIKMTHPDQPNSPTQRYFVAADSSSA